MSTEASWTSASSEGESNARVIINESALRRETNQGSQEEPKEEEPSEP